MRSEKVLVSWKAEVGEDDAWCACPPDDGDDDEGDVPPGVVVGACADDEGDGEAEEDVACAGVVDAVGCWSFVRSFAASGVADFFGATTAGLGDLAGLK